MLCYSSSFVECRALHVRDLRSVKCRRFRFDDVARGDMFTALMCMDFYQCSLPQKVNTYCMFALMFLRNNLLPCHS